MRERSIEKRFICEVSKRGGLVLKFSPPGQSGYADRIVLLTGARVFFAELKATDKKLRALQEKRKRDMEKLGFKVYGPVDSYEKIDRIIEEVFGE
jgi:hypothetical protein